MNFVYIPLISCLKTPSYRIFKAELYVAKFQKLGAEKFTIPNFTNNDHPSHPTICQSCSIHQYIQNDSRAY